MKRSGRQILILGILGAALLFNQVGLHFFHDSHKAHEYFSAAAKGKTMLLHHGEHCEVCAVEVLFHIVLPVTTEIPTAFETSFYADVTSPTPVTIYTALAQGRAPPMLS